MTTHPSKRPNPYAREYAHFVEQTQNHQLTVLHENGLYRSLRMRNPKQGINWSWSINTWPGHLATSGDIAAGFIFARDADMLEFFTVAQRSLNYYSDGAPCIDFRYWAEKLQGTGNYERVRKYSHETFVQQVKEVLEEHHDLGIEAQEEHDKIVAATQAVCTLNNVKYEDYVDAQAKLRNIKKFTPHLRKTIKTFGTEDLDALRALTDLDIDASDGGQLEYFGLDIPEQSPAERRAGILEDLKDVEHYIDAARQWLQQQENDDVFYDTWEWDLTDFDPHFVYACYALELTTRTWNEFCANRTPLCTSYIPAQLKAAMDKGINAEYSAYVLDGQTASTTADTTEHDGWHDVVAVVDNGDETSQFHKFTMDPEGVVTSTALQQG